MGFENVGLGVGFGLGCMGVDEMHTMAAKASVSPVEGSHVSMSTSGKMRWQNSWQVMVPEPSSSKTAKRRRNELGLRQTWLALGLGLGLGLGLALGLGLGLGLRVRLAKELGVRRTCEPFISWMMNVLNSL